MKPTNRIEYMDALRVISAFSVVLIHAVNPVVFSFALIPVQTWWLSDILNVMGRASVPLFVMLSGALLLDRSRHAEPDSVMFKKRLVRIGIIFTAWSVIYFLWRAFGLHQYIDNTTVINSLIDGTPGEQLYFLPLIAGLYAITPLLRSIVWSQPLERLTKYTVMLLVLAGSWQLFSNLPGHAPSYNLINQFVPFVGYYLLGYVLAQQTIKPSRWLVISVYLIGLLVPVVMTYVFVSQRLQVSAAYYLYDFINPFIALQAIGLWLLAQHYYHHLRNRLPKLQPAIHFTAKATLSLFLVHIIVLQFFASYIVGFPAASQPLLYIVIQVIGAGTAAAIIAIVLTRIPFVKRIVT